MRNKVAQETAGMKAFVETTKKKDHRKSARRTKSDNPTRGGKK